MSALQAYPVTTADAVMDMARRVLDASVVRTPIGTVVQPGPNYMGMWARDGMLQVRALLALGRTRLAHDLLRLYGAHQITEATDPSLVLIRRKGRADWHEGLATPADEEYVRRYAGAFPTNIYDGRAWDALGRHFRPGTGEIYGEVPDIDSAAWWVIEAGDLCARTLDGRIAREFLGRVRLAIRFLEGKDVDGDGLLEQGPNEDWADCLKRSGVVTYTQGVWYAALMAAATVEELAGNPEEVDRLHALAADVQAQVNTRLFRDGRYVEYVRPDGSVSSRVSQDTAWLLIFGMAPEEAEEGVLASYDELACRSGHGVVFPLYRPEETGPTRISYGEYHNGGVWTWISGVEAWARFLYGDAETGEMLLENALRHGADTTYEWVHGETGEAHNPGFATAAAALICAIREGRDSLDPTAYRVRAHVPHPAPADLEAEVGLVAGR